MPTIFSQDRYDFSVHIGSYQILSDIGKGGMGEVFLAYDPVCGRKVALKKMLDKWAKNETMKGRFFREARIPSQLSHPNIISIYGIEKTFYTMPHVEGETLKEILRISKEQSKKGEPLHPIGHSIPALIRIFLSICGAVAYAHSQGVLHRDLKLENILVGKYGEVILIDWGLAHLMDEREEGTLVFPEENGALTQPGKIPGTLMYLAPERAFGNHSTIQSDIYSLGVILYQLLTLKLPFHRKSIKGFRKTFQYERIDDPQEVAPEREISSHLSAITKQCLHPDRKGRFQTVSELIQELENYIEGNPQWQQIARLDPSKKGDWQFQENLPITRYSIFSQGIETMKWFNLMVSKAHFPGNLQIEAQCILKKGSKGMGILFCIPQDEPHKGLEESYCLWLSDKGIQFLRSNIEVVDLKEIPIETEREYFVCITLIDNHIRFFLDGVQQLGFFSQIALPGSRVGLLTQDSHFSLNGLNIAMGSQNILVNCLAVPDAFFSRKQYGAALEEYQKIAYSFPGRAEGREAIFRGGKTLIRQAATSRKKERKNLLAQAFDAFEKLHNTPGAPLEYLGKSQLYQEQREFDEEAKSIELALRKYPKHPLRPLLEEHLLSRLNESSQRDRKVAFLFALIVLRHLPHLSETELIASLLEKNLEPLPFFLPSKDRNCHLIIQLAFWLNKPLVLFELIEKGLEAVDAQNAHLGLILLGGSDLADLSILEKEGKEIAAAQFEYALKERRELPNTPLPLWKAFEEEDWKRAKEIAEQLPKELYLKEGDPHFFLWGCFLAHFQGEKAAVSHLTSISEKKLPPIYTLLSHFLIGQIDPEGAWEERALPWEKLKLYQQLDLYSRCLK